MSRPLSTHHQILRLKHELAEPFFSTFGVPLNDYMDVFTGFDSIRLDDEVVKSGDRCMKDVVEEKYGQDAVEMILRLLAV